MPLARDALRDNIVICQGQHSAIVKNSDKHKSNHGNHERFGNFVLAHLVLDPNDLFVGEKVRRDDTDDRKEEELPWDRSPARPRSQVNDVKCN